MKKTVSVVIPSWNGLSLLEKNLPSVIQAKANPANRIVEIIVVDDGSTDESVSFLTQNYPEVIVVRHAHNRGVTTSMNSGAKKAKGDFIALLNNDVLPSVDFLVSALINFQNPQVFAVSLHEKGYGPARGWFENGFVMHQGAKEGVRTCPTLWASGGSSLFRRDLWQELGGMDEALYSPYYWEDIDLSYRALKRGYQVLWEPKAQVVHQHESTTSKISTIKRRRIQERNYLLFMWKNLSSARLVRKHLIGLGQRLLAHPGYLLIVMMALRRLPVILINRKKLRKEEKVADEAIFAMFK